MIVCKSATTIGYIPSKTLTTYVVIIVWEYIYIYIPEIVPMSYIMLYHEIIPLKPVLS